MKKLSEASIENPGFKLLQVGESGAGKTHRSLSAIQFGPVFVIDIDDKLSGYLLKLPKEQQEKILYDVPKSADDVLKGLAKAVEQQDSIATIVLDTWSAWHSLAIESHLKLNKGKRMISKSVLDNIEQLAMQDWGAIKRLNASFLTYLLSLPFNIIVNTHVGKNVDDMGNQVLTVGTTGSFGAEMPRYFPETHQLYIDGNEKHQVKGSRANRMVANSTLPDSLFETNGNLKVDDLSIYEGIAKKV